MSKETGGPAFARPFSKAGEYSDSNKEHAQVGMTLRDYFAAKAMQAFCGVEYKSMLDCAHWARHAYMMADAMLAERAK